MTFYFNEIMFPKWNLNWPIWTQWQGIALNKIKLYRMGPWMTNYQGALPAAYVWLSFSLKLHFKNSCHLWNQINRVRNSYLMVIIHTNHCFENALFFLQQTKPRYFHFVDRFKTSSHVTLWVVIWYVAWEYKIWHTIKTDCLVI